MHFLWLSSLLWAEPVDDDQDASEPTKGETAPAAGDAIEKPSTADAPASESNTKQSKEVTTTADEDGQTDVPKSDISEPEEQAEASSEPEPPVSRVHGIAHIEGMALVLPSFEFGGGMDTVPTFTSGFMLNVGIGARDWTGNYSEDVPMKEFMQHTDPEIEIVAGYQIAYEEGRNRMNEAYAISTGGYLGFYEPKKEDIEANFSRFFADAQNGILIGLSKRTSLDDDRVPLPDMPQQWQFNATFSQSFEFIMIYQYSSIGFGSAEKELPWRLTYGLGVGAVF